MEAAQEKQTMTDEERRALAKKLDDDLENFIGGLEKKQYTEGWPEDRWQEEMEKHPFFMKQSPEPGAPLHPLMEGLQKLKYDPDENNPEELANNYKEDGNFNFKHKNYRLAIMGYTEGIKVRCGIPEVEAALLNNRSAAHYYLKNYCSSLRDAELALKHKPDHTKAKHRAAICCHRIKMYEKSVTYCDGLLEAKPGDEELLDLRQQSVQAMKARDRDERRKKQLKSKKEQGKLELIKAISSQGLTFETEGVAKVCFTANTSVKIENLRPYFPQLEDHMVSLDERGKLVWPVVFIYTEYQLFDFLQEFAEDDTFRDHLKVVFADRPDWDIEKSYVPENVCVYFEDYKKTSVCPVDIDKTLGEILKHEKYVIKQGTPSFLIVVRGSITEQTLFKTV